MSTSTDGGLTWAPKIAPPGTPSGGQPVVQPNGTVVGAVDRPPRHLDLRVPLSRRRSYLDVGRAGRIPVVCARRRAASVPRRCPRPKSTRPAESTSPGTTASSAPAAPGTTSSTPRRPTGRRGRRRHGSRSTYRRAPSTTSCPGSASTRSARRGGSGSSTTTTRLTPAVPACQLRSASSAQETAAPRGTRRRP